MGAIFVEEWEMKNEDLDLFYFAQKFLQKLWHKNCKNVNKV